MKKAIYKPNGEPEFEADALLPCPFCGYIAEIDFLYWMLNVKMARITCVECRCEISITTSENTGRWCAEQLIKKWNKRVEL